MTPEKPEGETRMPSRGRKAADGAPESETTKEASTTREYDVLNHPSAPSDQSQETRDAYEEPANDPDFRAEINSLDPPKPKCAKCKDTHYVITRQWNRDAGAWLVRADLCDECMPATGGKWGQENNPCRDSSEKGSEVVGGEDSSDRGPDQYESVCRNMAAGQGGNVTKPAERRPDMSKPVTCSAGDVLTEDEWARQLDQYGHGWWVPAGNKLRDHDRALRARVEELENHNDGLLGTLETERDIHAEQIGELQAELARYRDAVEAFPEGWWNDAADGIESYEPDCLRRIAKLIGEEPIP